MPKCVYCGKTYELPRGLTLIMVNGTINHLCSGKCRKNMLMKRRKVRWITKSKKEKVVSEKKVAPQAYPDKSSTKIFTEGKKVVKKKE